MRRPVARRDILVKSEGAFRPCAIPRQKRVLRRAWTGDRLTGRLPNPRENYFGLVALVNAKL